MSGRYTSYPEDEPVIGVDYPPRDGEGYVAYEEYDDAEEYDPALDYDDYDEYEEEVDPYYERYYADAPARQPLFYVFLGLAVVLGAAFIFLLFTLVSRNDEEDPATPVSTDPNVQFRINIDDPSANERIEIRKDRDVLVTATATEEIMQFELLLDGQVVDRRNAGNPESENIYRGTLRLRLNAVGEFEISVKAISSSGASQESSKVKVVGVEAISGTPTNVKGRILTQATLRASPSDEGESLGTVRENEEVNILGRTRDSEWLFIDVDNGGWVRRTAVELFDAVSIVPIRDGSPTPRPTIATPLPSPTQENTPTPEVTNVPDMVPTNAILIDGGAVLRVTVANLGSADYDGPIEVAVGGLTAGTLTRAFGVSIGAGGLTTVDFDIDPPVTGIQIAQIRVDPGNAIAEANEDNNAVNISVTPPVQQPNITITNAAQNGGSVTVTISNSGGPLQSSLVTVRVSMGNESTESSQTVAIPSGGSETFSVTKPSGAGQADVVVLVGGSPVASTTVTLTN